MAGGTRPFDMQQHRLRITPPRNKTKDLYGRVFLEPLEKTKEPRSRRAAPLSFAFRPFVFRPVAPWWYRPSPAASKPQHLRTVPLRSVVVRTPPALRVGRYTGPHSR